MNWHSTLLHSTWLLLLRLENFSPALPAAEGRLHPCVFPPHSSGGFGVWSCEDERVNLRPVAQSHHPEQQERKAQMFVFWSLYSLWLILTLTSGDISTCRQFGGLFAQVLRFLLVCKYNASNDRKNRQCLLSIIHNQNSLHGKCRWREGRKPLKPHANPTHANTKVSAC